MVRQIPTPRVRLRAMDEVRAYIRKDKPPEQPRRLKLEKPKRVYRTFKARHRLLVVQLRYGSITDYSRVKHRWFEIVKLTGIGSTTC